MQSNQRIVVALGTAAGKISLDLQLAHVCPCGSQLCVFFGPCLIFRLPWQLPKWPSVFTSKNADYNPWAFLCLAVRWSSSLTRLIKQGAIVRNRSTSKQIRKHLPSPQQSNSVLGKPGYRAWRWWAMAYIFLIAEGAPGLLYITPLKGYSPLFPFVSVS